MTDLIRRQFLGLAAACALAGGPALATVSGQTKGEPIRFSLVALDLEGGGAVPLRISIDRWTTDEENARLTAVLMQKGQKAFEQVLRDTRPTGSFRTLTSLGWDIRLARQEPGKDGGRHITLVTDRPIGFAESWASSRTLEYPFTVIELDVNNDNEGTGSMSIATKLIPDRINNILIVENFDNQRIRLVQVKKE
jgi:hypothetical protein